MGVELVVLDFDGTLTRVDEEAVPFVDGYKNDLAQDLGIGRAELEERWAKSASVVDGDPTNHGWKINGTIVAPAYSDPLLHSMPVAEGLLDEAGLYLGEEDRQGVLTKYFQSNYGKLGISFKDDTDEFLSALRKMFDVCIVTNSGTDGVTRKVRQLPTDHSEVPIHGDAKKHILHPEWDDVPESVQREGYGRPLFLRRKQYWNILSGIMNEREVHPENVAVVGDVYELDLLLPEHKGMSVVLTPRESTPKWEVEAVRTSSVGYVGGTLMEVLTHLESRR